MNEDLPPEAPRYYNPENRTNTGAGGVGIMRTRRALQAIAPPPRDTVLRGTIGEMAHSIATGESTRVLVLTGRMDAPNGLPTEVAHHGGGLRLRARGAYTNAIPTAIFEIIDEDALCEVVDQLKEKGGYKAQVLDAHGQRDPHYAL